MPTGRPTNAEFPTAASTPPVSIMTPEPGAAAQRAVPPPANAAQRAVPPPANTAPSSAANASLLSPRPTSASGYAASGAGGQEAGRAEASGGGASADRAAARGRVRRLSE